MGLANQTETNNTVTSAAGAANYTSINTKKVDDIIKDLEKKRESERYHTDKLSIVQNINEYIYGVEPLAKMSESKKSVDVYNVEIQCNLNEENQSDSDDDIIPATIQKGHRKSMVNINTKKAFVPVKKTEDEKKGEKGEENLNEKSKQPVFNDELKKQILQSAELNDFMMKNSKYIERV